MAKKRTAPVRPGQSQPKWINEICDTCRFSSWITDNLRHLDLNGKPICLRCRIINGISSEVVGRVVNGNQRRGAQ